MHRLPHAHIYTRMGTQAATHDHVNIRRADARSAATLPEIPVTPRHRTVTTGTDVLCDKAKGDERLLT